MDLLGSDPHSCGFKLPHLKVIVNRLLTKWSMLRPPVQAGVARSQWCCRYA